MTEPQDEAPPELTPRQRVAAAMEKLGLTVESIFVPWHDSRNFKPTPSGQPALNDLSLNWKVTLKRKGHAVVTIDYSAGCGHAPAYKSHNRSQDHYEEVLWECMHGYPVRRRPFGLERKGKDPIRPAPTDVIYCLLSEIDTLEYPDFEDWAKTFGYDTDSRKAEATYKAGLEVAIKIRCAIGEAGIEELREAAQDY